MPTMTTFLPLLALLYATPTQSTTAISCLAAATTCPLGTFKVKDVGTLSSCRCEPCLPGSYRWDSTIDLCTIPGHAASYSDSTTGPFTSRGVGNCTIWNPPSMSDYYNQLSTIVNDGGKVYVEGSGTTTAQDLTFLLNSWQYSPYGFIEYARTAQMKCGSLTFKDPVQGTHWTIYTTSTKQGIITQEFTLQNGNGDDLSTNPVAPMNFTYSIVSGVPVAVLDSSFTMVPFDTVRTHKKYIMAANLGVGVNPSYVWANGSGVSLSTTLKPFHYWNQEWGAGEYTTPLTVDIHITYVPVSVIASPEEWTITMVSGDISSTTMNVYNAGGDPITFNISTQYYGDAPAITWLSTSNSSAYLNTSCSCEQTCQPVPPDVKKFSIEFTATINATVLPAGTYGAKILYGTLASTTVNLVVTPGPAVMSNSLFQLGLAQAGTLGKSADVVNGADLWIITRDTTGSVTTIFSDGSTTNLNTFNITCTQVLCGGGSSCTPVKTLAQFSNYGWNVLLHPPNNGTWSCTAIHTQSGATVGSGSPLQVQVGAIDCSTNDPYAITSPNGLSCTCPPGYGEANRQFVYVTCEQCAKGTYSDPISHQCMRCLPDTISDVVGAAACTACNGMSVVETMTVTDSIFKPVMVGSMIDLASATLSYQASIDGTQCQLCATDYVAWNGPCAPCSLDKEARKIVLQRFDNTSRVDDVNGTLVVDVTWRAQCVCRLGYYRSGGSVFDDNSTCATCPTGAFCFGLTTNTILPLNGYFQVPWDPQQFQVCRNTAACPGIVLLPSKMSLGDAYYAQQEILFRSNTTNAIVATRVAQCPDEAFPCTTGYVGPGCFKCDVSYTRVGVSGCTPCIPSAAMVAALIIGLCLAIAFTIYLVRRAVVIGHLHREKLLAAYQASGGSLTRLDSAMLQQQEGQEEENNSEEEEDELKDTREIQTLKILTSHLQESAVTVSFKLLWPDFVVSLFNVYSIVSSAGQSLFSLDCLLEVATTVNPDKCGVSRENVTSNIETYGMFDATRAPSFFIEAIFIACIPVVWTLVAMAFWTGFYFKYKIVNGKSKGRSSFNYFLLSCIVLLFLLYPTLTKEALRFYSCSTESFAGYRFLEADFNIVCFGVAHITWAATLGVAMMLAFPIGCPLLTFIVLRHHHKNLSRYRGIFGFVFQGYQPDLYFWECVVMTRKLCFSIAAVLLGPLGSDLQAYAGLAVLIFFIQLQTALRPYLDTLMNRMELGGLLIRFSTILLGLALDSKNSSITAQTFFGVCIVVINAMYLATGARVLWDAMFKMRSAEGVMRAMGMSMPTTRPSNADVVGSFRGLGGSSVKDQQQQNGGKTSSTPKNRQMDEHAFENPVYSHMSVNLKQGGLMGGGGNDDNKAADT